MLQMQSYLDVADNTGAKRVMMIRRLGHLSRALNQTRCRVSRRRIVARKRLRSGNGPGPEQAARQPQHTRELY